MESVYKGAGIVMPYLAVVLLLLTGSCASRRATPAPAHKIIRDTWMAVEAQPNKFEVWVLDATAEAAALKELCAARQYVCAQQPAGRVITLERTRK